MKSDALGTGGSRLARRLATASALLGVTLALGGCMLGPNFHKPKAQTESSFRPGRGPLQAPKTVSHATPKVAWWQSFDDRTLTTLEKQATGQNLDIKLATQRLAEADANAQIEGAALYPNLNFAGSFTREKPSNKGVFTAFGGSNNTSSTDASQVANGASGAFGGGGIPSTNIAPFNILQYGFSSVFDFDLWGKNRRTKEAALAAVTASRNARRAVLLNTEAAVASNYIQLRGAQDVLRITEENLKTAKRLTGLTEQRQQAGLANDLDVADARAQEANVRAQLPALHDQIDALINQLSLLLGRGPEALRSELITPKAVPPAPPVVPVGLPAELMRRRPDIREAEANLHQATAEVGVATASFFPDITLSGSVSLQALQLSNLNQLSAVTYAIGPQLTLPIFEGGKLNGELHLTKAKQKQAAISYAKAVLTAFHQVDNALTAYGHEQHTYLALQDDVKQTRHALYLAEERYKDGLADYLQVLNAQQLLLQAQRNEAQSRARVSTDLVKLYQALGGGWQNTFPAEPKPTTTASHAASPPGSGQATKA